MTQSGVGESRRLRGAVVGLGVIALARHLPAYGYMQNVAITAICDADDMALKAATRLCCKAAKYSDFSRLFEKEALDFVDICVPSYLHSIVAKEALRRGIHVIVEKPLATSFADAAELVNLAKKNHVQLIAMHTFKFYDSVRRAKGLLESGIFGQAKAFTTTVSHYLGNSARDSWIRRTGGPLWEYGIHYLYLAQYLMGQVVDISVSAAQGNPEDNATINIRHEGGANSTIQLIKSRAGSGSFEILTSDVRIRIVPGLDVLTIGHGSGHEWTWTSTMEEVKMNGAFITQAMLKGLRYLARGVRVTPHYKLLALAVESFLRGGSPPVSTEEALETIRLVETIALKMGNAR